MRTPIERQITLPPYVILFYVCSVPCVTLVESLKDFSELTSWLADWEDCYMTILNLERDLRVNLYPFPVTLSNDPSTFPQDPSLHVGVSARNKLKCTLYVILVTSGAGFQKIDRKYEFESADPTYIRPSQITKDILFAGLGKNFWFQLKEKSSDPHNTVGLRAESVFRNLFFQYFLKAVGLSIKIIFIKEVWPYKSHGELDIQNVSRSFGKDLLIITVDTWELVCRPCHLPGEELDKLYIVNCTKSKPGSCKHTIQTLEGKHPYTFHFVTYLRDRV